MKNRDATPWYKIPTRPRPWAGATVYIIGGGRSLEGVDLSALKDERVIGTNMAFRFGADIIDALYFHDAEFLEEHEDELRAFPNPIYTHCHQAIGREGFRVMYKRLRGVSMDDGRLAFNSSSGGAAINLAAQLGAARIVLLGFDMHNHGDPMRPNWHDENAIALRRNYGIQQRSYDEYRKCIEVDIVPALKRLGIQLVNGSDEPRLTGVPAVSISDAIAGRLNKPQGRPRSAIAPKADPTPAPTRERSLTVACVWREAKDFPIDSVLQLHAACRRVNGDAFRFVCLTDQASRFDGVDGIDAVQAQHPDWIGWWGKLELFRPGIFGDDERVVFFDLDTAVLKPFDRWADGLEGLYLIRDLLYPSKLATGVMLWTGSHRVIYDEFVDRRATKKGFPRGSDQSWLRTWLPHSSHAFGYLQDAGAKIASYKKHVRNKGLPDDCEVVCFHGKPRPQDVDEAWLNEYREGLGDGADRND
jgi:hypothetical protein